MTQAQMRSLWRELTNERDTEVIQDTTVDLYLQRGLEALNRRVQYHVTDGTISLTGGTQEYALPSDFVQIEWVEWNNGFLAKTDQDQLRSDGVDWRSATAGNPTDYAIYGRKIVFYPKPSNAAVSTSDTVNIRYVSAPADFTANGAEQLSDQDQSLVVDYAVAKWAAARADGPMAESRVKSFLTLFEADAKVLKEQYASREMLR